MGGTDGRGFDMMATSPRAIEREREERYQRCPREKSREVERNVINGLTSVVDDVEGAGAAGVVALLLLLLLLHLRWARSFRTVTVLKKLLRDGEAREEFFRAVASAWCCHSSNQLGLRRFKSGGAREDRL